LGRFGFLNTITTSGYKATTLDFLSLKIDNTGHLRRYPVGTALFTAYYDAI